MKKLKNIHHATCPTVRIAGRGIGIGTSRTGIGTSRFGCFASQDPSYTGRVRDFFVRIDPSDPSVRLRRVRSGSGSICARVRTSTSPRGYFLPRGHPSSRALSQSARAFERSSAVRFGAKKRSDTIFPLRLPETTRGRAGVGRRRTGASTATGRNGTERNGTERSTGVDARTERDRKRRRRRRRRPSVYPSVRPGGRRRRRRRVMPPTTPTTTGGGTTGAIVVVASRVAAWAPATPTPATGRRPGRRRARGGKGG
jgi:hypothetical protein